MSDTVGKRLRFEVFKRDAFTCRYCGRKPPAVTLQADHVLPVSKGGVTAIGNLVTSCADCNSGKSNKLLQDIGIALNPEEIRERHWQMLAYEALLAEQAELREDWADELLDYWHLEKEGIKCEKRADGGEYYMVSGRVEEAIGKFLRYLVKSEIKEAIDIAFERKPSSGYQRFKFFCGICWRKIKGKEGAHVCEAVQPDPGLVAGGQPAPAALLH